LERKEAILAQYAPRRTSLLEAVLIPSFLASKTKIKTASKDIQQFVIYLIRLVLFIL